MLFFFTTIGTLSFFEYSFLLLPKNFLFQKNVGIENIIMIVKGAVLIPNIPDSVGDVLDEETIRKVSLIFNRQVNLIDVQHSLQTVGSILESYICDEETTFQDNVYPKGTWFVSVDVTDQEIQDAIRNGEYTGFSILAAPYKSVEDMRRKGVN